MAIAEPGPSPTQAPPKPSCVVTFGRTTLLGRHLTAALAASGRWSTVAVLDPSRPTTALASPLAHFSVDLSDPAALAPVLAGAATVFHVDPTSATSDGSFLSLHRLAVEGTRRLLAACSASGVRRVVYTGSADVVAAGARDVVNADEDSLAYPDKSGNALSELRAQVEMMVLSADGKNGMRTCVLRPSNQFGPGDSSLARFVAGYARSPLGKPFFVTNDEPIETWEFMSCMMEAMGCQRPRINLPAKMLLFAALFSNMVHHRLGLRMLSTPLLHPDTIYFFSCTRTLNTSKARRLLGYYPIVSLEDGIMRTVGSFSELPDNLGLSRKQGSCGSSKADRLLGGGLAADILLWRDEKENFFMCHSIVSAVLLVSAVRQNFYLIICQNSSSDLLALFIHGVLPPQVFGFTVEKVTSDYFEVSHSTLRNSLMCLASVWNGGIHILRALAEGDDWSTILKVVASLYSIKVMLNFQFRMLMALVLASLFIVFIVYEQCEEEIDSLVTIASVKIKSLMDRVVGNLPASLKAYIS